MAITSHIPVGARRSIMNKEVDFDNDTFKYMLLSASYTPAYASHRYKSDLSNEVSGTGYTAGGVTVSLTSITYDSGTDQLAILFANPTWTSASFSSPTYGVLYDSTPGSDATRPIILIHDFGGAQTIAGGFAVTWAPTGTL